MVWPSAFVAVFVLVSIETAFALDAHIPLLIRPSSKTVLSPTQSIPTTIAYTSSIAALKTSLLTKHPKKRIPAPIVASFETPVVVVVEPATIKEDSAPATTIIDPLGPRTLAPKIMARVMPKTFGPVETKASRPEKPSLLPVRAPPPPIQSLIDCSKLENGWYPDPKSKCSHAFYFCLNGIASRFECSSHRYFDVETKACQTFQDVVACASTKPPTKNRKEKLPINCSDLPPGQYVDPLKICSNIYYMCSNGDWFKRTCPDGKFFDPKFSLCDQYDDIFACTRKVKVKTTISAPKPSVGSLPSLEFNCTVKEDGSYLPQGKKCSAIYYRCVGHVTFKQICQDGFFYDIKNDLCKRFVDNDCSSKYSTSPLSFTTQISKTIEKSSPIPPSSKSESALHEAAVDVAVIVLSVTLALLLISWLAMCKWGHKVWSFFGRLAGLNPQEPLPSNTVQFQLNQPVETLLLRHTLLLENIFLVLSAMHCQMSGITIAPECQPLIRTLIGGPRGEYRSIIFKIRAKVISVITELECTCLHTVTAGADNLELMFAKFVQSLKTATSDFTECAYGVFRFHFTANVEGVGGVRQEKVVFFEISPEGVSSNDKMTFASSAHLLKQYLPKDQCLFIQITEESQLSYLELVQKLIQDAMNKRA